MEHQHRDRLDKLFALVQGGVGGEQENAERAFNATLAKFGYTRDEYESLNNDVRRLAHFPYDDVETRDMLIGIIKIVTDGGLTYQGGQPQTIAAEVTPRQCADVLTMYDLYEAAWNQAKSEFFTAFVTKHDIAHRSEITDGQRDAEYSAEETRKFHRIAQLSRGLENVQRTRRIGTRP